MNTTVDNGRRALLRGRRQTPAVLRPPWSVTDLTDRCTRCRACAAACPEQIIVMGDGGFPEIRFAAGDCTFCGECAHACPAGLFRDPELTPPWDARAQITDTCLARRGVYCQSCRDACEINAIRVVYAAGCTPLPQITDACTGCGACVAGCPVAAVQVRA